MCSKQHNDNKHPLINLKKKDFSFLLEFIVSSSFCRRAVDTNIYLSETCEWQMWHRPFNVTAQLSLLTQNSLPNISRRTRYKQNWSDRNWIAAFVTVRRDPTTKHRLPRPNYRWKSLVRGFLSLIIWTRMQNYRIESPRPDPVHPHILLYHQPSGNTKLIVAVNRPILFVQILTHFSLFKFIHPGA